jgi:hypothetical protein
MPADTASIDSFTEAQAAGYSKMPLDSLEEVIALLSGHSLRLTPPSQVGMKWCTAPSDRDMVVAALLW